MINRIKTQEHSFPYVIFITIFLRQNAVRLTNVNGPSGTVGHRTEVNVAVITRRIKNIHFLNRSVAVDRLCGVHRKVVDLVVSGLVDMMAEDIDDGKSVQMGEFGIFSPTIRAKSADDEKEVSSKSIVQRKILFYPGKIFKTTLDDMSITRRAELDTDYTDGSSNNGSGSEKPNPGGDGGKDDEEAPDPTV